MIHFFPLLAPMFTQEALRAALIFHTYEKSENLLDQLVGEVILVH